MHDDHDDDHDLGWFDECYDCGAEVDRGTLNTSSGRGLCPNCQRAEDDPGGSHPDTGRR